MSKVIGMNSGSSVDSIDVVLIEIGIGSDNIPTPPKVIDGITYEWPEDVHEQIIKAIKLDVSIADLTRLNFVVGAVYAEAVNALLKKCSMNADEIYVIGVDGQTVYQETPFRERDSVSLNYVDKFKTGAYACTLQIGEGAVISNYTKITTVTQFRPADIALGGTGAPLMQYLDYVVFRKIAPLVTLNIGGIANFQVVYPDKDKMIAFDTGPGNVMMDFVAKTMFNQPYDKNGEIARSGKINSELLSELLDHPFLKRTPPRNAWRLDFGEGYIDNIINKYKTLKPEDFMATFCEFTAITIAEAFKRFVYPRGIKTIIASGGGTNNLTLIQSIREKLPTDASIVKSDEYGIPAKFKEAVKFGTLGFATVNKLPNNLPSCSGASQYTIMGKVSYPPLS